MLELTRQIATYALAYGFKILYRFSPGCRKKADGPLRQRGISYIDKFGRLVRGRTAGGS